MPLLILNTINICYKCITLHIFAILHKKCWHCPALRKIKRKMHLLQGWSDLFTTALLVAFLIKKQTNSFHLEKCKCWNSIQDIFKALLRKEDELHYCQPSTKMQQCWHKAVSVCFSFCSLASVSTKQKILVPSTLFCACHCRSVKTSVFVFNVAHKCERYICVYMYIMLIMFALSWLEKSKHTFLWPEFLVKNMRFCCFC